VDAALRWKGQDPLLGSHLAELALEVETELGCGGSEQLLGSHGLLGGKEELRYCEQKVGRASL